MNLAHLLLRSARTAGERPALFLGEQALYSYAALAQRAATLGRALRDHEGLRPGDRVGLFLPNHPAVLEILFGCWWAGLTVVPINPKLHPREAHFVLGHSGAARVFVSGEGTRAMQQQLAEATAHVTEPMPLRSSATPLALIDVDSADYATLMAGCDASGDPTQAPRSLPVRRDGDDLAWLFYTSGTTGRPKGVMLTHRNLLTMTLCYSLDVDPVAPEDAALYAAPMSHGAGLYCLPHVAAAARHVVPVSRGFDVAEVLALAQHHGQVSMFAAPTMVRRLVDHAEAIGSRGAGLKTVVYGGGPMYVQDIQRAMQVLGPRFVQIYGQGESPMTITALSRHHLGDHTHPDHLARLGSVGVAQSAVEVRVTSDQADDLPVGEVGEVLVRGDTVMAGYWRDKAATTRAVRDGWLRTGDLGQPGAWAAATFTRVKSKRRCCATPTWPRCRWWANSTPSGARWWWPLWRCAAARRPTPAHSMRCAPPTLPASSGPSATTLSRACPRTTMARCSKPNCAAACYRAAPRPLSRQRKRLPVKWRLAGSMRGLASSSR
jgi:long-chain acyl-CoA synthetase